MDGKKARNESESTTVASNSSTSELALYPRRSYNPNIMGVGELVEDAKKVLVVYDAMDFDEFDDVDGRRKQVKERIMKIRDDANVEQDSEFCSHTIGICVKMLRAAEGRLDQALKGADEYFDGLAAEIRTRSPERLVDITNKLEKAQNVFRAVIDKPTSYLERAKAFGGVHKILLDALEQIDAEEAQRAREAARAKLDDRSLAVF